MAEGDFAIEYRLDTYQALVLHATAGFTYFLTYKFPERYIQTFVSNM